MPGYGLAGASEGSGLLPWIWAQERLEAARNYWVATTRPDGRPHCVPVWGLWLEGVFQFSTSPNSRKATNLVLNPYCTIATERADEAVIIEGYAEEFGDDPEPRRRFAEAYKAKYAFDMDPQAEGYFRVEPHVAFGFIEEATEFTGTATRWIFER
jgi:nitroimidazol reductase NimA-like FMN-containing flavoprotein (pyridoxamine 5'-phosphate oxidase superfamily)